jgi:hypothetical protein
MTPAPADRPGKPGIAPPDLLRVTLRKHTAVIQWCYHHNSNRPQAEQPRPPMHPEDAHGSPQMTLAAVIAALLAQEVVPTSGDIWRLGVIAVALLVGAAVTYRYTTLPERDARKAETAERIAAQEREREAYKVTVPALTQITTTLPAVLDALRQRQTP